MHPDSQRKDVLGKPLRLPCGAVLKNRIAKSSMSDSLGDGEGNATDAQIRLYERWAEGGAAVSMIGEVQFDPRYPEKPGNLVLRDDAGKARFEELTARALVDGAHLWPQIGHAGALSYAPIGPPLGPSSLDVEGLQCRGMSVEQVEELPAAYAAAARRARNAGFSGVHIHAGHGFLLSQFLSPLFNRRTDGYGGSIEGRSRIVLDIVDRVRKAVGPAFPIGIRINASDQLEGGLSEADALAVVKQLDDTSVDLIDISGGTYFPGAKSSSDSTGGGPYFVDFARRARHVTQVPLMVTGGFRGRGQAIHAIESGAADIVGLARSMVLMPELPNVWLSAASRDPVFPRFEKVVPGGITAWYSLRLTALGEDREAEFSMDIPEALETYDARDAERAARWKASFGL
ncbi:MAG: NADH:flavin oxidoreductase/NADH oxidase family protein [Pseudomonadota bacterium]